MELFQNIAFLTQASNFTELEKIYKNNLKVLDELTKQCQFASIKIHDKNVRNQIIP